MNMNDRNDIYKYCKEQLKRLYPARVPLEAEEMLTREWEEYLKSCGEASVDRLILFHKLSTAAARTGTSLIIPGTLLSSMVVWLLDAAHELNPLPAHYYCEHCGHFECGFEEKAGIDLPEKACPNCGLPLRRDGYTLYPEFAWTRRRELVFEYRIPASFRRFAGNIIREHYRGRRIVMPLSYKQREHGEALLPLPDGAADGRNDPAVPERYRELVRRLPDGRESIDDDLYELRKLGIDRITILSANDQELLQRLQEETGVFFADISPEDCHRLTALDVAAVCPEQAGRVLDAYEPSGFAAMAAYAVSTGNTLISPEDSTENDGMVSGFDACRIAAESKYPAFCREDAYEYLRRWMKSEEEAFAATEMLRTGKFLPGTPRSENAEEILAGCPAEFIAQAKRTCYLFPRGHGMRRMKQWLRLAWYADRYPEQFARMMQN